MSQTTDRVARLREEQLSMRALGDTRELVRVEERHFSPDGVPIEYLVTFACNGLQPDGSGGGAPCDCHMVVVSCGPDFPGAPPTITFTTPVWHPDVTPTGALLWPAGAWRSETLLVDVCREVYDLIRYKAYTRAVEGAGNPEAARWVLEVAEPGGIVNRVQEKVLDKKRFPAPAPRVAPLHDDYATGVLQPAVDAVPRSPNPDPMLALNEYASDFVRVSVTKSGSDGTAREYEVTFRTPAITQLSARAAREPLVGDAHTARVQYDPVKGEVRIKFVTPIFHPNLAESGKWFDWKLNPPRPLDQVCAWLYRRLRFQSYHLSDGIANRSAATWLQYTPQAKAFAERVRAADPRTFPEPPPRVPITRPPETGTSGPPGGQTLPYEVVEPAPGRAQAPAPEPMAPHPVRITNPAPPRGIRVLTSPSAPAPAPNRPAPAPLVGGPRLSPHHGVSQHLNYELRAPDCTQVEVVLPQAACAAMVEHARESHRREIEVAGFLVGRLEPVPRSDSELSDYRVTVTDVLRARSRNQTVAEVEFGVEVWQELDAQAEPLERQGKVRLGWYHTHPNQGIFFSPPDLNSHLEWRQPYQFGLVIDPRNMACGLLHWFEYPRDPNARGALPSYISEPLLFALQPGPLPGSHAPSGAPPSGAGPAVRVVPPRPPLSRVRFWGALATFLAGLTAVGLFGGEALSQMRSPLSIELALGLVALIGLLALARLWNAGAFHPGPAPAEPPEAHGWLGLRILTATVLVAGVAAAAARPELRGRPSDTAVVLLTLLAVVVVFSLIELTLTGAFYGAGENEEAAATKLRSSAAAVWHPFQTALGRLSQWALNRLPDFNRFLTVLLYALTAVMWLLALLQFFSLQDDQDRIRGFLLLATGVIFALSAAGLGLRNSPAPADGPAEPEAAGGAPKPIRIGRKSRTRDTSNQGDPDGTRPRTEQ